VMRLVVEPARDRGRAAGAVRSSPTCATAPYSERHRRARRRALNRYFERMTAQIHRHDGTVDNFRSDGIMCIRAPKPSADPCRDGFGAATEMIERCACSTTSSPPKASRRWRWGCLASACRAAGPSTRHLFGDRRHRQRRGADRRSHESAGLSVIGRQAVARPGGRRDLRDLGPQELRATPVRIYGWPARRCAGGRRDAMRTLEALLALAARGALARGAAARRWRWSRRPGTGCCPRARSGGDRRAAGGRRRRAGTRCAIDAGLRQGGAEYEVRGRQAARRRRPAVAGGAKLQAKDRLPDVYRDVKLKPARSRRRRW
jgi:hypothetical protein